MIITICITTNLNIVQNIVLNTKQILLILQPNIIKMQKIRKINYPRNNKLVLSTNYWKWFK